MRYYADIINASQHKAHLLQDIALHFASIKNGSDSDAANAWELHTPSQPYNESESLILFDALSEDAETFGTLADLLSAWATLPIDFDIGSEYPDFGFNYDTLQVHPISQLRWCAVTRGYRTATN